MKLSFYVFVGFFQLAVFAVRAQSLERHPYLQQPTQTSIGIQWKFKEASVATIRYYEKNKPELKRDISSEKSQKSHFIVLTNLTPNTIYQYEIKGGNGNWLSHPDYFFRTAPKDESQKIKIWAMGDFGDLRKQDYIRTQTGVRDTYVKSTSTPADLWLWLGDMAYGNNKDSVLQTSVFDFFGSKILSNTPIVTVPGNHEYYENNIFNRLDSQIVYFDIINPPVKGEAGGFPSFNKSYYSMRYGPLHIIALNSYGKENGKLLYDTDSKQYQWLQKELEYSKNALWKVVIMHHPPYTKRSHDSDAEQELVQLRKALVPLFDSYNVDLVLTGHSHIYERSHLIAGYTGHSAEFNPSLYIKQKVTGQYTPSQPPYINKKEGTIYCVVGSGGRLELPARSGELPHPTSVYSQIEVGGSLFFTIEGNRLDANWIASTGEKMDQFTIFKNVNTSKKIKVFENETIELEASWPGSYKWSHSLEKTKKVSLQASKTIQITVTDSLGYLKDVFDIEVDPLPPLKITSSILQKKTFYCPSDTLTISTKLTYPRPTIQYTFQLSDEKGDFKTPSFETKWSNEITQIILPSQIKESSSYKLRVIPTNFSNYESYNTDSIQVFKPLQVTTTSPAQIPYNSTIELAFKAEGSLPGRGLINASIPVLFEKQTQTFQITTPSNSIQYQLTEVQNQCGIGQIDNKKITVLAPLQLELPRENQWVIFPNPTDGTLFITIPEGITIYNVNLIDITGRKSTIFVEKLNSTLFSLHLNVLSVGKYILLIQTDKYVVKKTIIKLY